MEIFLQWLPIALCFIGGIGLIVLEAFLPGFGIAGISGIVLLAADIILVWTGFGALAALGATLIILAVVGILVTLVLRSAAKGKLSRSQIVLHDTENAEAGYNAGIDAGVLIGREGVTTTILRPTGIADFDGVRLDVVSSGDFIAAGCKVCIVRVEGSRIVVKTI